MNSTIEALKNRCDWLSDSVTEQRIFFETKLSVLEEKLGNINLTNTRELHNTIDSLNHKIISLETSVNQFKIITEQQNHIISESEIKMNHYIELIDHQQQAIEFKLHFYRVLTP